MMKRFFISVALIGVVLASHAQELDVERQLDYCNTQVHRALKALQKKDGSYDYTQQPRNILKDDRQSGWNTRQAVAEEWCSGFWPGILWMDYAARGDKDVKKAAEGYTESLRHIAYQPVYDHDIGFVMFNAFGKGYEQNRSENYKKVILASADSLATLYNPLVGTLLSWPRNVEMFGGHNTIMDNMMNLDLLFWAAAHGGNPLLHAIAVNHATTTMRHHFRPDGSCFHVAVYDLENGVFKQGVTHQGYADYSMWTRGQSWAIYGYTMVYRWTKKKVFLDFAQKVTDIYLRRLHEISDDRVPLWDFDDPRGLKAPKDASAACIVADALLELANYVQGEKGAYYKQEAIKMLADLSSSKYLSGKDNVAFLKHSTGHHPGGSEIDASIIYADYYYLEALLKIKNARHAIP